MKSIVISQPMFLPWAGLFEQLSLSDVFVHYDDVQLPRGRSFSSRVQIKTPSGIKWLSVPIDRKNSGKLINETLVSYAEDWRDKHMKTIEHSYANAPYCSEMMQIASQVYERRFEKLSELNRYAFELIASYFSIQSHYALSSKLAIEGRASQRLLEITRFFEGTNYITGLGALNYIDYEIFEKHHVTVRYMHYNKNMYHQLHGEFTPFVSILDLIANEGKSGMRFLDSRAVYWKEFIDECC